MIKKVQRKIVIIMMAILFAIFLTVDLVIVISSTISENNKIESLLSDTMRRVMRDNGDRPDVPEGGGPGFFFNKSFVVKLDSTGAITSIEYDDTSYTQETIEEFVSSINLQKMGYGEKSDINYLTEYYDLTTIVVGLDYSSEHNITIRNNIISSAALLGGYLLLSLAVWGLSYWIIKPIKLSLEKQKQFISDASHELKTPLTIINANLDVVKEEIGKENAWINNIESQTSRMNKLVNDMLTLAKFEEKGSQKKIESIIKASEIIENTVLSFDAVAYEHSKNLEIQIDKDISFEGDEESLKKITSILVDNAIKYSADKGDIKVTLVVEDNSPTLTVFNTGCDIKDEDRERIFERFYRVDSSRNQSTGGTGLGLSIVKNISDLKGWKISIDSKYLEYMKISIIFNK